MYNTSVHWVPLLLLLLAPQSSELNSRGSGKIIINHLFGTIRIKQQQTQSVVPLLLLLLLLYCYELSTIRWCSGGLLSIAYSSLIKHTLTTLHQQRKINAMSLSLLARFYVRRTNERPTDPPRTHSTDYVNIRVYPTRAIMVTSLLCSLTHI